MKSFFDRRLSIKNKRIAELENACKILYEDLLLRAEVEEDGTKVVAVGQGVWLTLCKVIGKI